jgi:hypothetical protein
MALESLAQKLLDDRQIAPFAEPELDCIAVVVNSAIQIRPLTSNFDIGLVNVPFPADRSLVLIEPFKKLG